jgi:hypothetical protein
MHSPRDGAEACDRQKKRRFKRPGNLTPVQLAETFQIPVILMERLRRRFNNLKLKWLVFLDNLFLNLDVAHVLLNWNIGVMGTTRKNSSGFPPTLQRLREINHVFNYGGVKSQEVDRALAFAWQDNNIVLALTTAFSVHRPEDFVTKMRRRPKDSSTNAAIARPIFGENSTLELGIPDAIDAYNHAMNYVDTSNQLRGNFSCHRRQEQRNWRPLGYWLFDICSTNAFVIWRSQQGEALLRGHRDHEIFQKELINALLRRGSCHIPIKLETRSSCAWGARNSRNREECLAAAPSRAVGQRQRQPLGEVSGNGNLQTSRRSRNVATGCKTCNVHLCTIGPCYTNWHTELLENCM